MRRLAFGLFVILCVGAAAFAASTLGPWAPVVNPEPAGHGRHRRPRCLRLHVD